MVLIPRLFAAAVAGSGGLTRVISGAIAAVGALAISFVGSAQRFERATKREFPGPGARGLRPSLGPATVPARRRISDRGRRYG